METQALGAGVDFLQGYWISRSLTGSEVEQRLRHGGRLMA
jgi:hypothetical protein